MGTSLTGLTPSTTYDALIKVGDNGPLSGSQKRISDGLGNDSAMSLSTSGVRVDGSALFEQSSASVAMTVSSGWGGGFDNPIMNFGRIGLAVNGQLGYDDPNTLLYIGTTTSHAFSIRTSNTERIRITPAGNVGIGTSTPSQKLEVAGVIKIGDGTLSGTGGVELSSEAFFGFASQSNAYKFKNGTNTATYAILDTDGLKFNGDTSASNALDDYEEGTWTMQLSFGGGTTGITYSANTGTYTKIGRQVTINGYIALTNKGSSAGVARIAGLPFTIPNNNNNHATASIWYYLTTFTGQQQAYGEINQTAIRLSQLTAGVFSNLDESNFVNSSEMMVNLTYFV